MNTPTRDGLLSLASLSQGGAELVQACLHRLYTPTDLEWLYRHGWTPPRTPSQQSRWRCGTPIMLGLTPVPTPDLTKA